MRVYPQLVIKENLEYRPYQGTSSAYEGGVNCCPAGGAGLIAWATRDQSKPTHHDVRIAAGNPRDEAGRPRGLSTLNLMDAFKAFGVKATRITYGHYSIAKDALIAGHSLGICADYATINAWQGGKFSGQLTFKGGHFIVLRGFRRNDSAVNGRNSTRDHDPLFDGRTRKWGTAPNGAQVVPFYLMRTAMENFRIGPQAAYADRRPIKDIAGPGLGIFVIVEQEA